MAPLFAIELWSRDPFINESLYFCGSGGCLTSLGPQPRARIEQDVCHRSNLDTIDKFNDPRGFEDACWQSTTFLLFFQFCICFGIFTISL
jgi:hypothetical protein